MNSKLSVLVVGVGSIGERHLRCFQQAVGCELGLVEPMESRRNEVADRYGVTQRFASLDDACRRDWDAAVICTPANWHVDHALQLLSRCRGLLIEKPLATKLEDAARLRTAAGDKLISVAYVYRAHPACEAVRKLIASGEIGDVLQATAVSGQHFPTFRPAYREIYYKDRRTGGGAIQDAMTHLANAVQYLVGRYDWVFCDYDHQCLEGVTVEDTVHLSGRAAGGKVMVSIAMNQFMAANESKLQINGSRGSVRIELPEHRYGLIHHGEPAWTWSEPLLHERDEWFQRQASHFIAALEGREAPACSLADAEHTLAVNLAALESAGKRPVPVSVL
ncbi:MAG: Gfo/Idh/MocA family oxidoreductase [Pirellulales bacterium]